MAIIADDAITKRASSVVVQDGTSALLAAGAFVKCATLDYNAANNSEDAPDAVIYLSFTPAAAIAAGQFINIHIQPLNIVGVTDTPVPSATYDGHFRGSFLCEAVGTAQLLTQILTNMPADSAVYIENTSGQNMNATWTCGVEPTTLGPKP